MIRRRSKKTAHLVQASLEAAGSSYVPDLSKDLSGKVKKIQKMQSFLLMIPAHTKSRN